MSRKKRKSPQNAVEVMQMLFEMVMASSLIHQLALLAHGDLIVSLKSGPHEGWAVRLTYDTSHSRMILGFYSFHAAALETDPKQNAMFWIELQFVPTNADDAKLGRMYRAEFYSKSVDILWLSSSMKCLHYVTTLLALAERLPSHHMWASELGPAHARFAEKLKRIARDKVSA